MTTTEPLYLAGALAPVPDEIDAVDLEVTGALPAELSGRYLRNGPNPLPGTDSGHWFTGHGMLHGVRIRDGRALWYRNRWVRTARLAGAPGFTGTGQRDLAVNNANTHIIEHGGALLALCEAGLPYRVTGELDTVGPHDFGGRLRTAMTAHPKEDPVTGELLFYGYSARPPYLTYHVADAAGELVRSAGVEVPAGTMMHDFAITENFVLWLDLPVVFDPRHGAMPFRWDDGYGARIGVMPRSSPARVRWFDIDPCYVFHVGNAVEEGVVEEGAAVHGAGRIVLDAVRYAPESFVPLWQSISGQPVSNPAAVAGAAGVSTLYRWTIDLARGTVTETALDDRPVEFPSLHAGHVGRPNRYLYSVANGDRGQIVKYDTGSGAATSYDLAPGCRAGEAVFVPGAAATAEDDGWLLTIDTPEDGRASRLLVLDATDVAAGPVAAVHLPRRVPAGFHGSWIADGADR